jgi:tetratricopeptide (TPR) repeat protein
MKLRRAFAELLNERGRQTSDAGNNHRAIWYYDLASRLEPKWSVPWYNRGLIAKYNCQWAESLRCNQRAHELDTEDEAACWNLGIAATALSDWSEARRAWKACGIKIADDQGEVKMPTVTACVRLNPNNEGEVVWGERIDPARTVILNVPLPESKHRFRDVILNDGAQNGTRLTDGVEVPVFDELAIWQKSQYSTFEANLSVPNETAERKLHEACVEREIGIEDWSTIRWLCAQCSRGNPAPHDCKSGQSDGTRRTFGLAAQSHEQLAGALRDWADSAEGTDYSDPLLIVRADT